MYILSKLLNLIVSVNYSNTICKRILKKIYSINTHKNSPKTVISLSYLPFIQISKKIERDMSLLIK